MTEDQAQAIIDTTVAELDAAVLLAQGAVRRLKGLLATQIAPEPQDRPQEPHSAPEEPSAPSKGALLLGGLPTMTFGGPIEPDEDYQ